MDYAALVIISLSVYIVARKISLEDLDQLMVAAIKGKLNQLNLAELNRTADHPRYQWSCNVDCLWI